MFVVPLAWHRVLYHQLWQMLKKFGLQTERLESHNRFSQIGILSTFAKDLLGRLEIEPNFLDKLITGDESWLFDYDP
jgi:hypothetical protein